jgi:hypothetical protein
MANGEKGKGKREKELILPLPRSPAPPLLYSSTPLSPHDCHKIVTEPSYRLIKLVLTKTLISFSHYTAALLLFTQQESFLCQSNYVIGIKIKVRYLWR